MPLCKLKLVAWAMVVEGSDKYIGSKDILKIEQEDLLINWIWMVKERYFFFFGICII